MTIVSSVQAGNMAEYLVHLDTGNAMNIKILAQVLHHQGFHVQVARHDPVLDALYRCGDSAQNAQFLAAIVEPGTL
jgi:esterase/lipase